MARPWGFGAAIALIGAITLAATSQAATRVIPASLEQGGVKADRVVVLKSRREMLLLRDGRVLRAFHVSLGPHPVGAKHAEGDGRTPEGHYVLDWRNPDSRYYLSIHISYPNAADIKRAERLGVDPGGDVMIHGLPPGFAFVKAGRHLRDWTEGCIAVTDREMDQIWAMVDTGTPIDILP